MMSDQYVWYIVSQSAHYNDVIRGAMATQITSLMTKRLLNRLFKRRSEKTQKLRVTVLFAGNSPVTGEFPAQMASNAENVSIWWRHHANVPLPCSDDKVVILISIGFNKNMHCTMSAAKWRPFCIALNVIIGCECVHVCTHVCLNACPHDYSAARLAVPARYHHTHARAH